MNLLRARSALSRSKGAASTLACASLSSSMRARALFSVSSRSLILVAFNRGIRRQAASANLRVYRSSRWGHRQRCVVMHQAREAALLRALRLTRCDRRPESATDVELRGGIEGRLRFQSALRILGL